MPQPCPVVARLEHGEPSGASSILRLVTDTAPRVLNMWGPNIAEKIAAAAPDVEIVDVPRAEEYESPPRGDAMFAMWFEHPIFDDLSATGVEWMHLPGTGVDKIPRHVFEGRTVTCSRGVSAIPIAEFVLGAMLAFEKDIPKVWLREPPETWNIASLGELADKTVGLVGLGGIGAAVARRALAFEMRVRALRRNPGRSDLEGVETALDLTDLLATADHLVIAAPATKATANLIDAEALAVVKPGVHLVNIARGTLVDQDALRVALDDGRVACASLDTVEPEPLPAGHWLYEHPKVRLSAHVSWASPHAFDRIQAAFLDNLRRYLAGEPLQGVVDPDEGY
jgi:phosphoglycerate dehydrogenase-like enzyme